ncbi:(4Fe-4S)-binding protein [Algoriphagus sediminis]|uniref:(4Fe-4S)-binding protein n=1 Tax=Algoriphagus sediminis TaxID=3057113 RepID=A0ABT7YAU5_9BACT|nr:(4Fe-4S)-binding protein [Algoriphagus sediminis]MDN3203634.1 (4Fe-4S)-binding protein [Algoriphagus sediminis]
MSTPKTKKEYSNGEVTITWEAHKCIHAANCVKGLPSVFDANKRPWINAQGASTEEIVNQVKACPSGALGYFMNGSSEKSEPEILDEQVVEIAKDGPLMVYGNITVKMPDGSELKKSKVSAFCRCGASQNKPFCDGSHKKVEFKG